MDELVVMDGYTKGLGFAVNWGFPLGEAVYQSLTDSLGVGGYMAVWIREVLFR